MSTQTLAELAKFVQSDLVGGVAEDIITVDPIFSFVPMQSFAGDAVVVNRENALGDAGNYSVGDTITDRTPSTSTQFSFAPIKIIGQVDLDKMVAGMAASRGVDMTAQEIGSKAKNVGRRMADQMVSGTGVDPQMHSVHTLVDSTQYTTASAGQALSLALLDELLDLVKAKDGQVDWIMGPPSMIRKYKALYRALGGADPEKIVITLPDGITQRSVLAYDGVPFFRNDYITITETANGAALTGGALTSIYAGVWDDGTRKVGCSFIYPEAFEAGIDVEQVGTSETKDEGSWRVKFYGNFVNFNRRGLARLPSLNQS